ncbi:MAG: hypothetical protein LBI49_26220, partial [Nocardiopsaceae bacterium]|nr:hypothetical protein [Nocardiopsaceae bacterium]
VHLSAGRPEVPYRLYRRQDLRAGDRIGGPAVITEHTATTVVHERDLLAVGRYGEMIISLGPPGSGGAP